MYHFSLNNFLPEGFRTTEIFLITSVAKNANVSVQHDGLKIHFDLKNNTDFISKRKKRNIPEDTTDNDRDVDKLKNLDYQRARNVILNHNLICNNENKNEICKDIVQKLKAITDEDHNTDASRKESKADLFSVKPTENKEPVKQNVRFSSIPMDMTKREVFPLPVTDELTGLSNRDAFGYGADLYPHVPPYSLPYSHQAHLPDSCFLARLLKHGNPHNLGNCMFMYS